MFNFKSIGLAAVMVSLASFAVADTWTLDSETSKIAFGSIKKNIIGEVHSFEEISGSVSADGAVAVSINLASVETLIDIRNERMMEHVFKGTPTATINAMIEMDDVSGLAVGESTIVDADGAIALAGEELEIYTELFVTRISETRVMATTNDMIMLTTADLGLTAGIDKLMELADLPGITRVSPITLRLVFDAAS